MSRRRERQGGKNAQAGNSGKALRLLGLRKGDPKLTDPNFWEELWVQRFPDFMRVRAWIMSMTAGQRPRWFAVLLEVDRRMR